MKYYDMLANILIKFYLLFGVLAHVLFLSLHFLNYGKNT